MANNWLNFCLRSMATSGNICLTGYFFGLTLYSDAVALGFCSSDLCCRWSHDKEPSAKSVIVIDTDTYMDFVYYMYLCYLLMYTVSQKTPTTTFLAVTRASSRLSDFHNLWRSSDHSRSLDHARGLKLERNRRP